ncbi:5826_t:CDS:2, partial [Scutellospora calospora]
GQLSKIKTQFSNCPIMVLIRTCIENNTTDIIKNLQLDLRNIAIVCETSFSYLEIAIEICTKSSKVKMIEEIIDLLNELDRGHAIIYCLTIKGCERILAELQKNNQIEIIIMITIFDIEINSKDVRLIIHTTFPFSMTNLMQETDHVACDGNLV